MYADMILSTAFFFALGTIIGSFLNVVILRYNTGRSVITARSSCPHCRHRLTWFELVPVFSFLALRGRCLKCRTKISWQYPLVEFFTGLIFAATYLSSSRMTIDLIIFSILIVILVYDLRHKIIPDGLVYAFIFLSFIRLFLMLDFLKLNLLDLWAGPVMFLPFFLLWYISDGRWMGFGDAKLAVGMGWFLGFIGSVSAIIFGFWIGAAVGIILLLIKVKKLTIKSEIPFAPFLILGLWLVYFFNLNVFNF